MHCFLDLLRSQMASWLSREGGSEAGQVHVWKPLVKPGSEELLPSQSGSLHCTTPTAKQTTVAEVDECVSSVHKKLIICSWYS